MAEPREPRVLVAGQQRPGTGRLRQGLDTPWRWVGWLGLMLTVAGVGDIVIAWVPPRLGTLEWEFGTIASSFAGLPLVAMGFGALLAGALGQGRRWMIAAVGWWLVASGVVLAAVYVIFLLDVPVALRAVTGEVPLLGIKRAVAKTTLLGLVFATGFTGAGIAALRHLKRGAHGSGD